MVADHEWALNNYLAKHPPLILYTAADLEESGIMARLQLYPTP